MNRHFIDSLPGREPEDLLNVAGITEPPVDLEAIVNRLGLRLSFDFDFEKLGHSGEISWSPDRSTAEIWVNPTDSERRQRFTLAHELGHFFQHMLPAIDNLELDEHFVDGSREFRRSSVRNRKEVEANNFSANLLMPKAMVQSEAAKLANRYSSESGRLTCSREEFISELADSFEVSSQAMEYRLVNLGIIRPE